MLPSGKEIFQNAIIARSKCHHSRDGTCCLHSRVFAVIATTGLYNVGDTLAGAHPLKRLGKKLQSHARGAGSHPLIPPQIERMPATPHRRATEGKVPKGQKDKRTKIIRAKSIHATRSPARPPKGGPPLAGEDPKRVMTLKDQEQAQGWLTPSYSRHEAAR